MKNNRPKSTTARDEKHPQHWYDVGYEDALDAINFYDKKLDNLEDHPLRDASWIKKPGDEMERYRGRLQISV